MKMKSHFIIILFCSLCIFACKKSETDPGPAQSVTNPPTTGASEYIRAKVNGTLVEATFKPQNSDVVCNPYFVDDDQFQMERYVSASSTKGFEMFLWDLDLDHMTYPRTIRQTNMSGDPYPEMVYNNGTSGADGNFVINNLDSTLFSITFSSFNGNILQGTFSGLLRWGGSYDSTLTFTNGEFKIKMVRF